MKLIETTTTIEQIGNITEENTFKMKSSRKAFQILSDLYSDKPLAIVRELGCNAADAMTAAGKKDEPFHIHLPNTLEPWITIQDFGTGISHENIYNIYATYFESTKTNSNDQIGCLGLGSKSPFCYADNFLVTSIVDGVKRTYNAFFNQQATPAISLMSTTNTTESNGISIQIPVKEKDFDLFINAVKKAFRFFDVKPTLSGGKVDWTLASPMFQGQGWKSFDNLDGCYAIMGGVTYPVDIYKLADSNYQMGRKAGLVLYFNMGEIDFAPSREHLSYCDATINAINAKFDFVKKDFITRINDMIQNQPTILDAMKAVYNLQNKFAYIDGMAVKDKIVWQGQDITNPVEYLRKIGTCMTYHKPGYYRRKITESVQPSLDSLWVNEDIDRGALIRVKHYVVENADKRITLFPKATYDALIASGFPTSAFTPVSTMPTPAKASRKSGGNRAARVKGVFNVYYMGNMDAKGWEGEQKDSNNPSETYPKYYIVKPSDNWAINFNLTKLNRQITDKGELLRLMCFLKINKNDLCMVSDRNINNLPDDCEEFTSWVNDNIDLTYDADGLATIYKYSESVMKSISKEELFQKLPDKHEFKKFVYHVLDCFTKYDNFKHINHWLNAKAGKEHKVKNELLQKIIYKMGSYSWDTSFALEIISNLK